MTTKKSSTGPTKKKAVQAPKSAAQRIKAGETELSGDELDKVTGGTVIGHRVIAPKMNDGFGDVVIGPIFGEHAGPKTMSYRNVGGVTQPTQKRSLSELYEELASEASDEK
jgi:hypothetical protein